MQLAAVSGIFGVVMSIGGDRWNGTLPYLFGTPANRIVMFFGRALVHVLTGILTVAIGFMWGVVLLRLDLGHTNLGLLALTILVTTLSTCGLGLLMGCIGLITVNVMFVNNTVYFLLLIFSGANIPPASLPGWMQAAIDARHRCRPGADHRRDLAGYRPPAGRRDTGRAVLWLFRLYFIFVVRNPGKTHWEARECVNESRPFLHTPVPGGYAKS
jgi:hypothetical protein